MERTCENCIYDECSSGRKAVNIVDGKCEFYVPMTNADHIRAMSDEELASLLSNIVKCEYDCIMYIGENSDCIGDDYTNVIKWLQQPRKVEE